MRKGLIAKALLFCFYILPLMAVGNTKGKNNVPLPEECPVVYYYTCGYQSTRSEPEIKKFFLKPEEIELDYESILKNTRPFLKNLEEIQKNGLIFTSYSTDSHKQFKDWLGYGYDLDGDFDFGLDSQFYTFGGTRFIGTRYTQASEALSDLLPGKSYIITFVIKKTYVEKQDEGVIKKDRLVKKYMDSKDIVSEIDSDYVHVIRVDSDPVYVNVIDKPIIEEYPGDTANTVLHYGTTEEVSVKTPNGLIKVNKNALPEVGIGDGSKLVFTEKIDLLSCGIDDFNLSLTNPFELIKYGRMYYQWLDLGFKHNYLIYDIVIKKKEGDHYLAYNGWKVYVPDERYREYFDSQLKENNDFRPVNDHMCYKLSLIQEKGVYEFVLEARPYSYQE